MRSSIAALMLLCFTLGGAVFAQSARKDSGNNAQLMQQMQQMASERTQLQADNARLKRELEELRKERDGLRAGKESNDKRVRNSEVALAGVAREREQAESELMRVKEQTQELIGKFRETIQQLRVAETANTEFKQQLAARDTEFKTCVDHNATLFRINEEVLARLEGQGFWTGVTRAEPFTRLKRVELENLADEYRGRAEDARVSGAAGEPIPVPGG